MFTHKLTPAELFARAREKLAQAEQLAEPDEGGHKHSAWVVKRRSLLVHARTDKRLAEKRALRDWTGGRRDDSYIYESKQIEASIDALWPTPWRKA